MEKSAETISLRKFRKLSTTGQHKVLLELVEKHLHAADLRPFHVRYRELLDGAAIDRFAPAGNLTDREYILALQHFHRSYLNRLNEPVELLRETWEGQFPVTVVLEGVRSPYNLGSIFRLIDNFGFEKLVSNMKNPKPDHPQCQKAARGTQSWIPFSVEPNLKVFLATRARPLVAIELAPQSIPLFEWTPPAECDLLLGNEAYGISEELLGLADTIISIPMQGYKHSMNISHALACVASYLTVNIE
ncbi:MAG: hypothetical protein CSA81_05695 [Acidobacteria bacterium]|nr:MAG: hypothetical protein CSA81_05695 [Acidobacteriota bacterium]PIE90916.1 MAG: hypothetical protein CR997_03410 [Acidobacteriota bacterium]